jgi:hypothetical protein
MALFWITLLMGVAAYGAISTVLKSIRAQERDLALLEPYDVAQGGPEGSK